jgi:hypothetical protein
MLPNWPLLNQSISNQSTNQPSNQSAINESANQPSASQPASISVRNSNPPVVDATELATAQSVNQQSATNQQPISNQSAISQSSVISEHGSSPLAGLHRRLVVCSAARRPSNTFINKHCFITPFTSHVQVRALRCHGLLSIMFSTDAPT